MAATALLGLFTTQAAHIALTFDSETNLYTIVERIDKAIYGESKETILNTQSSVNAWRYFNRGVCAFVSEKAD